MYESWAWHAAHELLDAARERLKVIGVTTTLALLPQDVSTSTTPSTREAAVRSGWDEGHAAGRMSSASRVLGLMLGLNALRIRELADDYVRAGGDSPMALLREIRLRIRT